MLASVIPVSFAQLGATARHAEARVRAVAALAEESGYDKVQASSPKCPSSLRGRFDVNAASFGRRQTAIGFAAAVSSLLSGSPATASNAASIAPPGSPDLPPWLAAASGAVQGAAQNIAKQVVLHPFDTVKTRVQTAVPVPRGDLFRGLYRGFLPCVVSGTPGSSAFFAAKEFATSTLKAKSAPAPLPTLGGVVAGVLTAKAVKTPFDVAETRAMANASKDGEGLAWDGSLAAARAAFDAEGFAGLYRGYGANVAYKLPADAAKFLAYEALRAGGAESAWSPAVAGAAATLMANAVTTPLDVVRTRVMVNGTQAGATTGVVDTFKSILAQEDGGQQLFAGLGWRLARGIVAGAIQFSVLEKAKDVVEGRR